MAVTVVDEAHHITKTIACRDVFAFGREFTITPEDEEFVRAIGVRLVADLHVADAFVKVFEGNLIALDRAALLRVACKAVPEAPDDDVVGVDVDHVVERALLGGLLTRERGAGGGLAAGGQGEHADHRGCLFQNRISGCWFEALTERRVMPLFFCRSVPKPR